MFLGCSPGRLAAAEKAMEARIALVADPHVNLGTNGDQAKFRARFDRVIAAVNAAHVDFVLIAGDLTQEGKSDEYDAFNKQVAGFQAPFFCTPGNRDLGQKLGIVDKSGPGGPTPARTALYERKIGFTYFSRVRAGVRIIGINSPVMGSGHPLEQEMWQFLESELAKPVSAPTVVFTHYPPFVKSFDEQGENYFFNIDPAPRARLLALLKKGGVRTVVSGHLHYPVVNRHDGILYVTTLPVSFGLPVGNQQGWTLLKLPREGEPQVEFFTVGD